MGTRSIAATLRNSPTQPHCRSSGGRMFPCRPDRTLHQRAGVYRVRDRGLVAEPIF